jgi:hypothetical protein
MEAVIDILFRIGGFCLFAALSAGMAFVGYTVAGSASFPIVAQVIVIVGAGGIAVAFAAVALMAFDPD